MDLAAGVKEGKGIEAFEGGKQAHPRGFRGEDEEVYLVELLEEWFGEGRNYLLDFVAQREDLRNQPSSLVHLRMFPWASRRSSPCV